MSLACVDQRTREELRGDAASSDAKADGERGEVRVVSGPGATGNVSCVHMACSSSPKTGIGGISSEWPPEPDKWIKELLNVRLPWTP